MSAMYRDRAFCVRSMPDPSLYGVEPCGAVESECDRVVSVKVVSGALKAKQHIGWADLQTSKCGYVPREGE